jgi:hypothetical protein
MLLFLQEGYLPVIRQTSSLLFLYGYQGSIFAFLSPTCIRLSIFRNRILPIICDSILSYLPIVVVTFKL